MNAPFEAPLVERVTLPTLADLASSDAARVVSSSSPFRNVVANLTVCVGSLELSVGDLVDAKVGQTMRLSRMVDEPVDLMIGDALVARGNLVAVDDYFGIQLTELPSPLAL